jgi:hypothetical protein
MKISCKTAVLAGVAGGYFLGRTRKAKFALVLASLIVGRHHGPKELVKKGLEKVGEMPQLADLSNQVRDDLTTAARTAVTSIVNRRIDKVSDFLHERTENLIEPKEKEPGEEDAGKNGKQSGTEEEEDEEGEEGEEPSHGPRHPEKRARRREQPRSDRFNRR